MSQQQQDEERRRQEDELLEKSLRISGYACAMIKRAQLNPPYAARGDTTPDGRNIASWNRHTVNPQMQTIEALNARARERKK